MYKELKTMDIVLLILAGILMLIGIIGCIIPGVPGVPVSYVGMLIAQATARVDFSWQTLVLWGIVTVIVSILDYVIPAWGAKRYGGSSYGMWGSTIGVFVGLFLGPLGVLLAPLVGAVVGELIEGKEFKAALKAGWGSFLGLFFGTILKLVCSIWMTVVLVMAIW